MAGRAARIDTSAYRFPIRAPTQANRLPPFQTRTNSQRNSAAAVGVCMNVCTVRDQCTCVCAPASRSAAIRAGQLPSRRRPAANVATTETVPSATLPIRAAPKDISNNWTMRAGTSEMTEVPTQYRRSQRNGSARKTSLAASHTYVSSPSMKLGKLTTPPAVRIATATTTSSPNANARRARVQSSTECLRRRDCVPAA